MVLSTTFARSLRLTTDLIWIGLVLLSAAALDEREPADPAAAHAA